MFAKRSTNVRTLQCTNKKVTKIHRITSISSNHFENLISKIHNYYEVKLQYAPIECSNRMQGEICIRRVWQYREILRWRVGKRQVETNEDSVSDVYSRREKPRKTTSLPALRPLDLSRGLSNIANTTVVRRRGESISILRKTYIQPEKISANFLISSRRRGLGLTLVKVQFVFPLGNLSILF